MNAVSSGTSEAFFLPGTKGPLFALHYLPAFEAEGVGSLLLAPPFAEEMNRCRAMVAMQARALAAAGLRTLVLDLYGTGDSDGDFGEATWEQWKDDLLTGIRWLEATGRACTTVWGVRLGALLAFELAQTERAIDRILLWQPVVSGKSFLTQILRIRVAAELGEQDGAKGTNELRENFKKDLPVEVAGYEISPRLGRGLDEKSLSQFLTRTDLHVDWFEVLSFESASLPRAQAAAIKHCVDAGLRVDAHEIRGPAFWQVHERALLPELIEATTKTLARTLS